MKKFEYKLVDRLKFQGRPLTTSLNELGKEGWLLTGFTPERACTYYYIFVREIPQPNPQQDVDV